jgi:Beta-propeller repeat
MAIDSSGNVYVTGGSAVSDIVPDYATVKYDSAGQQQWVAYYSGPGNNADFAEAIAVDASGNVYVTGESYTSPANSDYVTIKYNSSGQQQWVARYDGPAHQHERASGIAVDGSGNVYVTGWSWGSEQFANDYATIKYNSAGQEQWVARYNGPANSSDYTRGIAVDDSGNVYVTGESFGSGTERDYATIKYSPSGQEEWVARYNGPGNGTDAANALAVDGSGNVYVTGTSVGTTFPDFDYATIKYNSAGQEQWVARYNSPGNGDDGATRIAIDGSGNVYVTGGSIDPITNYEQYVTIKYNSGGQEQWDASYSGPYNGAHTPLGIAVDGSGNVYVTGQSAGPGFHYDYATVKYDPAGTEQWVARYNGPGDSEDSASAIAVDGSGNVYVAGTSVGLGTNTDYATIKYVQGPPPSPTPSATASPTPTPTPTPTATPTATATAPFSPTPTGTPSPSSTPIDTPTPTPTPSACTVNSPTCGIIVLDRLTDFIIEVSDSVDPVTVQASDLMVNGIPASAFIITNGNTTITFHFNTSPVVVGDNIMRIPAGAFDCGPPVDFICTFNFFGIHPTPPRPFPTPRPRPTPSPRP